MKRLIFTLCLYLALAGLSGIAAGACISQTINFGETKNGALTSDDCTGQRNGGSVYYDYHEFSGTAGQQIAISYSSIAFDTFLQLDSPDGTYLLDDDAGGGTNSRIPGTGFLTLTQTGTFAILATSFSSATTGAYTLTLGLASAANLTVVEYFNPDLNNFFITADPGEQNYVDSGAVGRWQRTGNTFMAGGPNQVCRFFGNTSPNPATGAIYGPNSHFYTVDAGECAYLQSIFNPQAASWRFESNDFSSTAAVNRTCAGGLIPVYRAYNNGSVRGITSNHRITSNANAYQQMVAAGWSDEGTVMCAPPGGTTANCTYVLASTGVAVPAGSGTGNVSVSVTAGCGWSANSNASWITITGGASGSGSGTVSYSVSVNTSSSPRTGTLSIGGQTYAVSQAGAVGTACAYSLSSSSTTISANGGPGSVGVVAPSGCAWTAASNVSWITISNSTSGSGNGTIGYVVAPNSGSVARSGMLSVAGNVFTVTQGGTLGPCSVTRQLVHTTPIPATGGTLAGDVLTQAGCAWTAVTDESWITFSSTNIGTGYGTFQILIGANSATTSRNGMVKIVFAGQPVDSGDIALSFTQEGGQTAAACVNSGPYPSGPSAASEHTSFTVYSSPGSTARLDLWRQTCASSPSRIFVRITPIDQGVMQFYCSNQFDFVIDGRDWQIELTAKDGSTTYDYCGNISGPTTFRILRFPSWNDWDPTFNPDRAITLVYRGLAFPGQVAPTSQGTLPARGGGSP